MFSRPFCEPDARHVKSVHVPESGALFVSRASRPVRGRPATRQIDAAKRFRRASEWTAFNAHTREIGVNLFVVPSQSHVGLSTLTYMIRDITVYRVLRLRRDRSCLCSHKPSTDAMFRRDNMHDGMRCFGQLSFVHCVLLLLLPCCSGPPSRCECDLRAKPRSNTYRAVPFCPVAVPRIKIHVYATGALVCGSGPCADLRPAREPPAAPDRSWPHQTSRAMSMPRAACGTESIHLVLCACGVRRVRQHQRLAEPRQRACGDARVAGVFLLAAQGGRPRLRRHVRAVRVALEVRRGVMVRVVVVGGLERQGVGGRRLRGAEDCGKPAQRSAHGENGQRREKGRTRQRLDGVGVRVAGRAAHAPVQRLRGGQERRELAAVVLAVLEGGVRLERGRPLVLGVVLERVEQWGGAAAGGPARGRGAGRVVEVHLELEHDGLLAEGPDLDAGGGRGHGGAADAVVHREGVEAERAHHLAHLARRARRAQRDLGHLRVCGTGADAGDEAVRCEGRGRRGWVGRGQRAAAADRAPRLEDEDVLGLLLGLDVRGGLAAVPALLRGLVAGDGVEAAAAEGALEGRGVCRGGLGVHGREGPRGGGGGGGGGCRGETLAR